MPADPRTLAELLRISCSEPVANALLLVLGVGILLGKLFQLVCVEFEARHVQTSLELASKRKRKE
eukprot:9503851-Pyramimonas_sp.AAC.5